MQALSECSLASACNHIIKISLLEGEQVGEEIGCGQGGDGDRGEEQLYRLKEIERNLWALAFLVGI